MNSKVKKGEFDLIGDLKPFCFPTGTTANKTVFVERSVGDDAAILTPATMDPWVHSCDALVEGRHFIMDKISPEALGRRAAAVNLSDIAAMGAQPVSVLVSLFVTPSTDSPFLQSFYVGMSAHLAEYGAGIIGGNVAAGGERFIADVFICGQLNHGRLLTRDAAKPEQLVCVTGSLGGSALGGRLVREEIVLGLSAQECLDLRQCHIAPVPRVVEGMALSQIDGVGACMDISDGLLQDAGHMARASDVRIIVDAGAIPVHPSVVREYGDEGPTALELALTGGEDYELLFTVDAARMEHVRALLDVAVTPIGRVAAASASAKRGVSVDGHGIDGRFLVDSGFDHLR